MLEFEESECSLMITYISGMMKFGGSVKDGEDFVTAPVQIVANGEL